MNPNRIILLLTILICCTRVSAQESEVRTVVQTGHSAPIIDYDISADGKLLSTVDKNNKVIIWNIKTGHQIREFNAVAATSVYFNSKSNALVVMNTYSTSAYDVMSGKNIGYWNNTITTRRHLITDKKTNPRIAALKIKRRPSSLTLLASSNGSFVQVRDANTKALLSHMASNTDKVNWAITQLYPSQCTPVSEDTWWTGGDNPVRWNLRTGKITHRLPFKADKVWRDNHGEMVFWDKSDKILRYGILSGEKIDETILCGNGEVHGLAFLTGDKNLVYDRGNRIWQTNLLTGKSDSLEYIEHHGCIYGKPSSTGLYSTPRKIDTRHKYYPDKGESTVMGLGATEFPDKYVLLLKDVLVPMQMDLGSKNYISGGNMRDQPIGLYKIDIDKDLICGWKGAYLMKERKIIGQYISFTNTCASPFGNDRIAIGKNNGAIHIFDRQSSRELEIKQAHQDCIRSITQHPSGRLAMATSDDNTVSLFRTDTNELVAYLITCNNGQDYIIRTPDNYYMSSQYGTDAIHFVVGTDSYNFDQFDLKYNRPDIVLSRIGLANKRQIQMLYNAYKKRLRRMNFTEDMLSAEFHVPNLKILNANQLLQAKTPQQDIKIDAQDSKYNIRSINVWINGVPVYGMAGKHVAESKHINISIPVTLVSGDNTIQVSCMNDRGAESYRETLKVSLPTKNIKPHLWLVTIGASQYADQRFNLSYAAKDAKDIEQTLSAVNKHNYQEIHTLLLTDSDVKRDKLKQVREFLSHSDRDDTVILFYAGHGMTDQSFDYFLGTYDTDFANPASKSIPYEEFESLLDGIAPLRKLLLLDACHSGEIDKEDAKLIQASNSTLVKQGIIFRSAGVRLQGAALATTEEIEGVLADNFSQLQRGSGTTIISSSSGLQVSREGDQWNNGLFTYCILQGLRDKNCDKNGNGG